LKELYDVVIIGGGPAGSFAGYNLAKRGLKILIVERKKIPGEGYFCGEGISTSGLTEFITPAPEWISTKIEGAIFIAPSGRNFQTYHPDAGWVLDRSRFDKDLFLLSVNQGASFFLSTTAVGLSNWNGKYREVYLSNNKTVKARVVIGADGVDSLVGRWAGIPTRMAKGMYHSTYQYYMYLHKMQEKMVILKFGREVAPGGYIWIFPKGKNTANVGIGIDTFLTNKKPKYYLDKFIKEHLSDGKILYGNGGGVPTCNIPSRTGDGVVLIGDAARVTDPISGGGISNALLTAKIASDVIGEKFSKKGDFSRNSLRDYDRLWKKKWGNEMKWRIRAKEVWKKLKDKDLEILYEFGRENFHNKTIYSIEPLQIIKSILKWNPKLLRIGARIIVGI